MCACACVRVCVLDGDRTKVLVLYPEHGVTKLQKLQLLSSCSKNISIAGELCIITLCRPIFSYFIVISVK